MHRLERIRRKGLALLSIIMMVGLLPLSAIAETEPTDPETTAVETPEPEITPSEQPAETPEPEETPAETPEPEETPEPTAEPEETPAPEYLFERETVLLTEILDAVG